MKFYGVVALSLLALTALESNAYTFTFRNHFDFPMTVKAQLIGIAEKHHEITVPAKGQESFNFWGLACLENKTLRMAKQGESLVELPIVYILSQKAYDNIMADVRKNGRANQEFSTTGARTGICRDQVFDIIPDINGNPRAIMVY